MANYVSIRGFVSSDFGMRNTPSGLVIGNFRMGSSERIQDPITKTWTDGHVNWYRITAFRSLAQNAVSSIHKGDRILVMGRMTIKTYLRKDGTEGTSVEIEADSIGPDLKFGTAHYTRMAATHPVGQTDSSDGGGNESGNDAGSGASADYPSEENHEQEPSEDPIPTADGTTGSDPDRKEDAEDDAAHPAHDGENGFHNGERVNLKTGEIVKEPAPF